jgi:hypothetical protein
MKKTIHTSIALFTLLTLAFVGVGVHAQTTNDTTVNSTTTTTDTGATTVDTTNPGLPNTGVGGNAAIAITAVLAALSAGAIGVYSLARRSAF